MIGTALEGVDIAIPPLGGTVCVVRVTSVTTCGGGTVGRDASRTGIAIADAPDDECGTLVPRLLGRVGATTGVARLEESPDCGGLETGLAGMRAGGSILALDADTGVPSLCAGMGRAAKDCGSGTAEVWRDSDPGRVLCGLAIGLKTVPPFSETQVLVIAESRKANARTDACGHIGRAGW